MMIELQEEGGMREKHKAHTQKQKQKRIAEGKEKTVEEFVGKKRERERERRQKGGNIIITVNPKER